MESNALSRAETSVRHAQTLSPGTARFVVSACGSEMLAAFYAVSVHDAGSFAAELSNDAQRACPRRGRVGCREFPDCF
jgi:hypothetical protein